MHKEIIPIPWGVTFYVEIRRNYCGRPGHHQTSRCEVRCEDDLFTLFLSYKRTVRTPPKQCSSSNLNIAPNPTFQSLPAQPPPTVCISNLNECAPLISPDLSSPPHGSMCCILLFLTLPTHIQPQTPILCSRDRSRFAAPRRAK